MNDHDSRFKDELIQFCEEENPVTDKTIPEGDYWKVLVVDDERDIHVMTQFAVEDYRYQGKPLQLFNAYSVAEAKTYLRQHLDIAVLLLDVVMETDDAGLLLIKYIREELQNRFVRIVLRTGQPGYAPEKEVIIQYDINDYKNKTELSYSKLFTTITANLRAYSDMMVLESYRQRLEDKVLERTQELQQKNSELLQLMESLQQLNREKTEFLRLAAQDIQNPLSSIQELSVLIQRTVESLSRQELLNFVHIIEVSSQRMVGLIKDLLDMNAIESGNLRLAVGIFDFQSSLPFLKEDYLELAREKNIQLDFQFPDEACRLMVNKSATLQVLDNLVSNAIKYSPSSKCVAIRISKREGFMRCEIEDEGPGLSEEDRILLFGKFMRLTPNPIGNDKNKTGLGLFIVKKLVEAMNGHIWCESELGKGATFIVELPLAV